MSPQGRLMHALLQRRYMARIPAIRGPATLTKEAGITIRTIIMGPTLNSCYEFNTALNTL
jgi:hypothetical protein